MNNQNYLDYTAPELGYTWLPTLSRAQWNIGLDQARRVLDAIGAEKGDERITLSFRHDGEKRFAVICGLKYISGFYSKKEEVWMRFYIGENFDISPYPELVGTDFEFKDGTSLAYAKMVDFDRLAPEFHGASMSDLKSFANDSGKTRYPNSHLPWMWDVLYNTDAREEFLTYIERKPQERILRAFKSRLVQDEGKDEWYKWKLAKEFRENWNLEASDFSAMLGKINFGNLLDNRALAFIKEATKHPEEAREYFIFCMDESIPEKERIAGCKQRSAELLKKWRPKWSTSGQDERTLSVLWTFNDPEKHVLYKASIYNAYCRYADIQSRKAGKRYEHYRILLQSFVADYIRTDDELLNLCQKYIPPGLSDVDPKHQILAQTVIYVVLEQMWASRKEEADLESLENDTAPVKEAMKAPKKEALNQILYGPPGTGKTYRTIDLAVRIAAENEYRADDHAANKETYNRLVENGRVVFTTFHQSFGYEDFVEGIKPVEPENEGAPITYRTEQGVFKKLCLEAAFSIASEAGSDSTTQVLDFSRRYDAFVESAEEALAKGVTKLINTKSGGKIEIDSISSASNIIVKHHERERTYTVSKARLSKLNKVLGDLDSIKNIHDEIRAVIGGSNSTTYWAVLNAIRAMKVSRNDVKKGYSSDEKIETVAAMDANVFARNNQKPFILIIDEINRGNVSAIFGELITLIEEDKRLGQEEAQEVVLPYSKEKFGIPPNVYLIGTMNTADRSVEALDTALRRRFSFREMLPEPELVSPAAMFCRLLWAFENQAWSNKKYEAREKELLNFLGASDALWNNRKAAWTAMHKEGRSEKNWRHFPPSEFSGYNLQKILEVINGRIEVLLDKDHTIGHAYFIGVRSIDDLAEVFRNKLIPLLQEYFYNDYVKIGMVLGAGFVKAVKNKVDFAYFEDSLSAEYDEKVRYELVSVDENFDLATALDTLLNPKAEQAPDA